jgi:hypothetical protein
MTTPTPKEAFVMLMDQTPVKLADLVGGGGLYALEDECGVVRYIGETGSPFLDRIYNRHCAGDDNSHKYSTAFNAGRLWGMSSVDINPVKRKVSDGSDGKTSKELRTLFTRLRCRARVIDLPHLTKPQRKALEAGVLAIAPEENKRWNDKRLLAAYEPHGLDEFIAAISWPANRVDAVGRQRDKWDSLSEADRAVIRKKRSLRGA